MYSLYIAIKKITIRGEPCIFAEAGTISADAPGVSTRTAMADQPTASEPGDRTAVANYVATLSGDLATMARRTGLETLGYLLEMARLEAENAGRHEPNVPR
jgi:hypothetical protein